ncbi:MAG: M28 family peptidase [Bacteroidota bacterium]
MMRNLTIFFFATALMGAPLPSVAQNANQITVDSVIARLDRALSGEKALESAGYFTKFWRIGGGPEFDSCLQFIEHGLEVSGMKHGSDAPFGRFGTEESRNPVRVWTPLDASLTLESPEQRTLHSYKATPLMLCSNSYPQDVTAGVVFVGGAGSEQDFSSVDVSGKFAFCNAPPSSVFRLAVKHGAIGIISSHVPDINHPELYPDIVAEGSIPYDETAKSFGIKISPRTADELKKLLTYAPVSLRVRIQSSFSEAPFRTLVAEFPGRSKPEQRVVIVAHLDHYKPGANDNASGAATLLEIARTFSTSLQNGTLPPPERTLTMLWVDEYRGTREWIAQHQEDLKNVQAVLVMDMVGGNPEKTHGTFRIEKMPDPGLLWMRSPDSHSGWGVGKWEKDRMFASYLNDFVLSLVNKQSQQTGWKTAVNVWEGGSDHDPFLEHGIPAILAWHFPDHFYHTSMDDIDKIMPVEMHRAGVSIGGTAIALAYGNESIATRILSDVTQAAAGRLSNELQNSTFELSLAQAESPEALKASKRQERKVIEMWEEWYKGAISSTRSVVVGDVSTTFEEELRRAIKKVDDQMKQIMEALGI